MFLICPPFWCSFTTSYHHLHTQQSQLFGKRCRFGNAKKKLKDLCNADGFLLEVPLTSHSSLRTAGCEYSCVKGFVFELISIFLCNIFPMVI
jgi:hypothetical protein